MNADLGFDKSIAGHTKAPLAGARENSQRLVPDTKLGSLPRELRRSRKDSVTGGETSHASDDSGESSSSGSSLPGSGYW